LEKAVAHRIRLAVCLTLAAAGIVIYSAVQSASAAPPVSATASASSVAAPAPERVDYKVLATNKTSTMQKEMQEAAEAGFQFGGVMGGETSFGGSEVVVVMQKTAASKPRFDYRLLATSKTSTMQKEMQEAGDAGFEYRGQTVFKSTFGGKEVVTILERDREAKLPRYEYRLLATKKTSTMQKELLETGEQGFAFVGMTVADTAMGGSEVVSITRRKVE
jgi:hypothetical protein